MRMPVVLSAPFPSVRALPQHPAELWDPAHSPSSLGQGGHLPKRGQSGNLSYESAIETRGLVGSVGCLS